MEQVDKIQTKFRYELGDGAYITGVNGVVTIVASVINLKAAAVSISATALNVDATVTIKGDVNIIGDFTASDGTVRLN